MKKILPALSLLRIHQWTKNFFIFLPVFFSLRLYQIQLMQNAFLAFLGFSLIASSVYILNDLFDIEADKKHPKKKFRPLASGTVKKSEAIVMMAVLLVAGLLIFILGIRNYTATGLAVFYVIQNILYTVKLKHISIADVMIISLGFILRILIGGVVTGIVLSQWIILMTFLLALFLALAKRRDDVLIFNKTGDRARKNIDGYNLEFLNVSITIMASVVIVCYVMYTTSAEVVERAGSNLYQTAFFVILGIIRYLQVTFVYDKSGSPTMLLIKDRFLQFAIAGWIISLFVILYLRHYS